MRNSSQILRAILLGACSLLSLSLGAQQAKVIWEDSNPLAGDFDQLLPEAVSYQRAVAIEQGRLDQLQIGDLIRLELAPSEFVTYRLLSSRRYLNGDLGWSGTASIGGKLATLSLIVNDESVLARVHTGSNRYTVAARLSGSSAYLGYLYTQGEGARLMPIDEGGLLPGDPPEYEEYEQVLALSGNDVSITHSLSADIATVGDEVDVSITITNNTASTLSNEQLNVLFVLEDSLLTSSSASCSTANPNGQFSLQCNLPDIAPGENTIINYSVQLTDDSYPFMSSSAFVGDIFSNENVRDDAFVFVARDTVTDSDSDGQSDFNEALVGTDPENSASVIAANTAVETDIMFLYTQRFVNDTGGVSPETKINQLVEITNSYYSNSGVDIMFRPVLYRFVDYSVNNSIGAAITELRDGEGIFSFVPDTRDQVGADIVVLIDGYFQSDSACGIGSTPGIGYNGEIYHASSASPDAYVVQYTDGFFQQGSSGCDDLTLAHELGHNHGLNHSRREEGTEGTFPWSLGHGVDGSFHTIMAYATQYPGAESIPLFSNPESTDCNGLPCGVSRDDVEQGADAVHSLNHTRFQVSMRRTSRILPVTSLVGSSNLIAYGGASRSSDPNTPVSSFSAGDSIDVRATLEIPSEHQGTVGETYVVISVGGIQFYYRDASGNYESWDGEMDSLQPNIAARTLNTTEELIAFENFVPVSVGVDAAALTVFFAYAIPGTDVFVYSSNGVSLTIQ